MKCVHCQSENTNKYGKIIKKDGWYQRYICKACCRIFSGDKIIVKTILGRELNDK